MSSSENQVVSKDHTPTRRKALKKLLVGGGAAVAASHALPTKWTKPVVDSVILPAHAQTTVVPTTTVFMQNFRGQFTAGQQNNPIINSIDQPQEGLYATILDTVIPNAHAGGFTQRPADMCIEVNGTSFTATLVVDTDIFTASGIVGGGSVTMTDVDGCRSTPTDLSVNSASTAGADYTLSGLFNASGVLPVGSGCPTDPFVGCE